MSIQKANIKKHIQSQPSFTKSNNSPGSQKDPYIAMAEGMMKNMSTGYKLAIAGAIYAILSGVITNIYLIYKLITLLF